MKITIVKLSDKYLGVLDENYVDKNIITCDMVICGMNISCMDCVFHKTLYEGIKKEYLIYKEVEVNE